MLSHRLQLLLDDERYQRVTSLARQRKVSVAAVIREAIDRGLPSSSPRRRAQAGRRILAAVPTPMGEPEDLVAELNDMRARRA